MILAEADFAFNWNTAFNCLMAIGTIGLFFLARKKQSVEVTFGFSPVSKKEFEQHVERDYADHEKLMQKIESVDRGGSQRLSDELHESRLERKGEISELHEKVNHVAVTVGGLEKATELQNQSLAQIRADVQRLLQRP